MHARVPADVPAAPARPPPFRRRTAPTTPCCLPPSSPSGPPPPQKAGRWDGGGVACYARPPARRPPTHHTPPRCHQTPRNAPLLSYLDGSLPADYGFDPLGLLDPEGAGGFINPRCAAGLGTGCWGRAGGGVGGMVGGVGGGEVGGVGVAWRVRRASYPPATCRPRPPPAAHVPRTHTSPSPSQLAGVLRGHPRPLGHAGRGRPDCARDPGVGRRDPAVARRGALVQVGRHPPRRHAKGAGWGG